MKLFYLFIGDENNVKYIIVIDSLPPKPIEGILFKKKTMF